MFLGVDFLRFFAAYVRDLQYFEIIYFCLFLNHLENKGFEMISFFKKHFFVSKKTIFLLELHEFFSQQPTQYTQIMKQCLRNQLLLAVCLLLIPLSGFSQKSNQQSETPAPFPRLISTGNPDADKINHEKAVQAWKEQERERVERVQREK